MLCCCNVIKCQFYCKTCIIYLCINQLLLQTSIKSGDNHADQSNHQILIPKPKQHQSLTPISINQVHIPINTPTKSPPSKVNTKDSAKSLQCHLMPSHTDLPFHGSCRWFDPRVWHCVPCWINLHVKLLLLHLLTVISNPNPLSFPETTKSHDWSAWPSIYIPTSPSPSIASLAHWAVCKVTLNRQHTQWHPPP